CIMVSSATCASPDTVTSNALTISVTAIPPTPTASANSPLCEGIGLQLNASNIANASYSWTGPHGFTSLSQNPVISSPVTADSGLYQVVATVNGCSSAPGTVNVVVNASPGIPTIGQSGD